MPYEPNGGADTDPSAIPIYHPFSDFDYQSFNLALYQKYIELDLFRHGLEQFSNAEFDAAGIGADERYLIQYMSDQEVRHAKLITNILGQETAAVACNYTYPFTTVHEFVDFCQKLTWWGESGVAYFLSKLDSRATANLLFQSIEVEGRQQMVFRQFSGLFPMLFDFVPGIPQSMAWTLLAPYISSCPARNPRISPGRTSRHSM